jgi:hypothetical protein
MAVCVRVSISHARVSRLWLCVCVACLRVSICGSVAVCLSVYRPAFPSLSVCQSVSQSVSE